MKKLIFVVTLLMSSVAFAANSDGRLPDPTLTPGVARTTDISVICDKTKSTKDERHVTDKTKQEVRKLYGMNGKRDLWCNSEQGCEIDHLISLELGGANDVKNLWPQPYEGAWNAHDKDKLENKFHKMICGHQISVQDAQHKIATDWISAYKKYIGDKS